MSKIDAAYLRLYAVASVWSFGCHKYQVIIVLY